MYIHNLNPTLLNLGPVEIRYYGLIYALGFLLIYWTLLKKKEVLKISKEQVEEFVVYSIIGIVVGSRLGHILLWNPEYYLSAPLEILKVWKGGMAFHGGLLGVILAGLYFCRKNKVKVMKLFDILSIPAVLVLAIGRLGNWMNGELWGTVTNVSWCVQFQAAEGCRHPYQLYAFAKRMVEFGLLIGITKLTEFKDGFLFWMMVLLLGLGRVFLDTVREDALFYGLRLGQWYSLGMVLIAVFVLLRYYRKDVVTTLKFGA